MASLIDVFAQNKTTETTASITISRDEGSKDSPSLFDSLLKDSAKKLEKSKEEVKTTEVKVPQKNVEQIENLGENKNIENELITSEDSLNEEAFDKDITDKKDTVSSQNQDKQALNQDKSVGSFLDRLIIEAKSKISKEVVVSKDSLEKLTKNIKENKVLQNKDSVKVNLGSTELKDNLIKDINSSNTENIKVEVLEELDTKTQELEANNKLKQNNTTNKESEIIVSLSNNENIIDDLLVTNTKPMVLHPHTEEKVVVKQSLMDYLIEVNSQKNIIEKPNINSSISPEITNLIQENSELIDEFISSLYLGEQKNSMTNQFLSNKNEVIKLLQNGTISLEDIKKGANILDLELDDVSIEQDDLTIQALKETKQDINLSEEKKVILNTMLNEKNIRSADIKNLITQSVEASKAILENSLNISDDVTVNINSTFANNIQSRIIGAQQHMSQMMSDIARQMYENYKPPVTVFKINLNPAELGSIAILMKSSNKSSSLDISMNVSNMTTLDVLLNNQSILRSSLMKTFNENMQFNLDFSSSNQNNKGNEQSSNRQNRKFEDKLDTQSVLKLKEENKNRDDSLDYM